MNLYLQEREKITLDRNGGKNFTLTWTYIKHELLQRGKTGRKKLNLYYTGKRKITLDRDERKPLPFTRLTEIMKDCIEEKRRQNLKLYYIGKRKLTLNRDGEKTLPFTGRLEIMSH